MELVYSIGLNPVAEISADWGFESLQTDNITVCDGMYTCGLERSVPERDWECESPHIDKI